MRFFKLKRAVVTTAVVVAATVGINVPSASALPPCSSGYMCVWEHAFGGGAKASFSGNNPWWGQFPKSTGGNWNDVATSGWNNGVSCKVLLFQDINFVSHMETWYRQTGTDNLGKYMNDRISSNRWCA